MSSPEYRGSARAAAVVRPPQKFPSGNFLSHVAGRRGFTRFIQHGDCIRCAYRRSESFFPSAPFNIGKYICASRVPLKDYKTGAPCANMEEWEEMVEADREFRQARGRLLFGKGLE